MEKVRTESGTAESMTGPSPFPRGGASRKALRPAVQDRNQAAQGSERPLLASCRKRRRLTGPSKSRAFVLPAAPAERFRENARSLSRRSYRITSAGRPPPDGSHRTARTRLLLPSPWAAPVPRKDDASVEPPASGPLRRERFRESVPADRFPPSGLEKSPASEPCVAPAGQPHQNSVRQPVPLEPRFPVSVMESE